MGNSNTYNKSPFKWAGGKGKALPTLLPVLEKYRGSNTTLVEPFIGAANVSLNIDFDNYIWNDLNLDLINSYDTMFKPEHLESYIEFCEQLFEKGFDNYNSFRDMFNFNVHARSVYRVALFQYLNKHGFNGLARYNKAGYFNVPKGTVTKNPKKVPVEQILKLHKRHYTNTKLMGVTFQEVFELVDQMDNCLVYSDPPYVPLTSEFNYTANGFGLEEQVRLKELSKQSPHTCIISNHWTPLTEDLYKDADEIIVFEVQRTISSDGDNRKKVQEVIAVYEK